MIGCCTLPGSCETAGCAVRFLVLAGRQTGIVMDYCDIVSDTVPISEVHDLLGSIWCWDYDRHPRRTRGLFHHRLNIFLFRISRAWRRKTGVARKCAFSHLTVQQQCDMYPGRTLSRGVGRRWRDGSDQCHSQHLNETHLSNNREERCQSWGRHGG